MSRLLYAVEEAKKRLSFEPYAHIREAHLAERDGVPVHLDVEISRADYEGLIRHLLDTSLDSVYRALNDAGKRPDQIDEVLLVGGASRTPLVAQLLEDRTGLVPPSGPPARAVCRLWRRAIGRPPGRPQYRPGAGRYFALLFRSVAPRGAERQAA